jgi:predicted RNase H-like HicB family nuclease
VNVAQTYRVELERLDRGYEARVPGLHGVQTEGLTEGEALRRLADVLGRHALASDPANPAPPVRMEVFRT